MLAQYAGSYVARASTPAPDPEASVAKKEYPETGLDIAALLRMRHRSPSLTTVRARPQSGRSRFLWESSKCRRIRDATSALLVGKQINDATRQIVRAAILEDKRMTER
jgi:hypothetical protein